MRRWLTGLLAAGLLVTGMASAASAQRGTITDIVAQSGGEFDSNRQDFDVLLNAVQAAGLDGALADPAARLTVFAPRDGAFIILAQELGYSGSDEAEAWAFLVDALTGLGGGDPIPVLTDVLLYHVSPWKLTSSQVLSRREINTLLGVNFKVRGTALKDLDGDMINPKIVATDIKASNGIVHVISRVLLPVDLPN